MTSRWVVEVTAERDVPVRWRAYSLAIKNEDVDIPEEYRPLLQVTLGTLRVVEAVWAEHGDEPIGRLYTEIGNRFHLQDDKSLDAVADALEAAGLDRGFVAAADEERWDAEIRGSMAEAIEQVGTEVAVPILLFRTDAGMTGISGPVMSPAPTGDAALAVWDSVSSLAFTPNFFELKRKRTTGPQL
ncbi:MAG TPA: hypothetical protein VHT97_11405 [Acidimicrobiales bacterium]|jgi:hypothetical protein|nr:hypothetical protein [Acidimicrobiales bacterium]